MSRSLQRWGRFAARRPWVVIGAWLAISMLVLGGSAAFGEDLEDTFSAPGVDSQKATELMARGGSDQGGVTAQIVVTPVDEQDTFRSSATAQDALVELQRAAEGLPHVLGTGDAAVSPDGRVALIRVQYPVLEELSSADLENLKELAAADEGASPLRIELGGELLYAFEEPETGTGEVLGLVVAMVILLLGFGSVVAMGLPIGMALFGIVLGVGSMSLITRLFEIPSWAPVIASMVGLGVGIDYALFIVTRHREYLATGMSVEESVGRAVATAGRAVVVAGGTVVIAILGLAVSGVPFLTAGGIAVSVVVLIMVLASVTLLPRVPRPRRPLDQPARPAGTTYGGRRPARLGAGRGGAGTSPAMRRCTPSAAPCCSWPWRHRCWRSGSARPMTDPSRSTGPSAGPTTSWPRASGLEPTVRWSSPSTPRGTPAWWSRSPLRSGPTRESRGSMPSRRTS